MDPWEYKPARDLGMPMHERLRSAKRESGLLEKMGQRVWATAMAAFLRWGEHLTVEGREHLPTKLPFVLAANHSSHLDVFVLAGALAPDVRAHMLPLAAADTFFLTPVHAAFAAGFLNALPIFRKTSMGHHAIEELRERLLTEPCGFILFPEGTRTRTGQLGPFKAGLGMLVAGTPIPVIPCHIRGTFEAWPHDAKTPKSGVPIHLRIGAAMSFEKIENHREGWHEVSAAVEQAVKSLTTSHP
jgi:1-acyl-sn-glycerol-3-phosphate acyltransferase